MFSVFPGFFSQSFTEMWFFSTIVCRNSRLFSAVFCQNLWFFFLRRLDDICDFISQLFHEIRDSFLPLFDKIRIFLRDHDKTAIFPRNCMAKFANLSRDCLTVFSTTDYKNLKFFCDCKPTYTSRDLCRNLRLFPVIAYDIRNFFPAIICRIPWFSPWSSVEISAICFCDYLLNFSMFFSAVVHRISRFFSCDCSRKFPIVYCNCFTQFAINFWVYCQNSELFCAT